MIAIIEEYIYEYKNNYKDWLSLKLIFSFKKV